MTSQQAADCPSCTDGLTTLSAPSRVELYEDAAAPLPIVKPVIMPLPALSTYSRLSFSVRLVGRSPPDGTLLTSARESLPTARTEMSPLPALTTNRNCELP